MRSKQVFGSSAIERTPLAVSTPESCRDSHSQYRNELFNTLHTGSMHRKLSWIREMHIMYFGQCGSCVRFASLESHAEVGESQVGRWNVDDIDQNSGDLRWTTRGCADAMHQINGHSRGRWRQSGCHWYRAQMHELGYELRGNRPLYKPFSWLCRMPCVNVLALWRQNSHDWALCESHVCSAG
jgi:hypothetical protein